MQDFKKFEKRTRNASSLDGVISGGRSSMPQLNSNYSSSRGAASDIGIGNFSRSNGFTPVSPQPIGGNNLIGRNLSPYGANGVQINDEPASPKLIATKQRFYRRKWFKRIALIMAMLIIATGAYFGVKLYLTGKHIFRGGAGAPALQANVDASKLNGEGDGRINILVAGKGGDNHPGGELTDTLLLASIDPTNREMALLSVPRDLWVKIPNNGYQKINAAYEYGRQGSTQKSKDGQHADGIKTLKDTLSPVLGIPIHYYVMVDFTAFKDVVNTVGGIDITLDEAIYDPNFDWQYGRNALKLPKGNVHLNGTQALLLGRARGAAGGYGINSDFDRNENQRKMLIALSSKVLSAGTYGNPVKINQLITALGTHVKTSFSSVNELMRLYQITKTIPSNKVSSLDLVTPPNNYLTTGTINGLSVVYPRAGQTNYKELQNFIRNTLKDGFLRNEDARVAVYNATNVNGLAARQAEVLRSYGYTVTVVADAPTKSNGQKSVVVDLTKGVKKYTNRYLEQRFKTTATGSIPDPKIQPGQVDFVIILGQDAINTE